MKASIFIAPHERHEALDAYSDRLSEAQKTMIRNADDGASFELKIGADGHCMEIVISEDVL